MNFDCMKHNIGRRIPNCGSFTGTYVYFERPNFEYCGNFEGRRRSRFFFFLYMFHTNWPRKIRTAKVIFRNKNSVPNVIFHEKNLLNFEVKISATRSDQPTQTPSHVPTLLRLMIILPNRCYVMLRQVDVNNWVIN